MHQRAVHVRLSADSLIVRDRTPHRHKLIYDGAVKLLRSAVLLLCLGATGAARADEATLTAKEHYNRGTVAYGLGKYDVAAREYEAAFEKRALPELLFNAAQAHRLANNKRRAIVLYQNYLRLFGDRVQNTDEVQRLIGQLKSAVAAEDAATSSPPQGPKTVEPGGKPTTVVDTKPSIVAAPPAPPRKRTPAWVWGVVGAGAAVVIAGVAVGVVFGTRPHDPSPSLGSVRGN